MEGGTFQSPSLARASRKYVFVLLHQTREDSRESYRLITEEYLPEEFLHPVYFFLRPDGTEVDAGNRHHHEALGPSQILKILDGIQRRWGRGLTEKEYAKHGPVFAEGRALFSRGKPAEAAERLAPLAGLKARCGLRDRAAAMRDTARVSADLASEWRELGCPERALFRGVAGALRAGDLPGAWRRLRARAEEGRLRAFREKIESELRRRIRLLPVRLSRVVAGGHIYWYLKAAWRSDLPAFDGLVLQLGYLCEGPRTCEGYARFDRVEPAPHHRAALSAAARDLRLRDVLDARARLWLDGLLLHESHHRRPPRAFPAMEDGHVLVGPDLLRKEDALAVDYRAKLVDYRLGTYRSPARKP